MELLHLRTFVIVADEASVTKAAQRLYMTPPTVSGHIKALEDELNVILFVRTPKGMKLTAKGELLRDKAEKTLYAAQDLVNHATELQAYLIGEIKFGLNATPEFLRIAELVLALDDVFPGVNLNCMTASSGKIATNLHNHTFDAGYIFGSSPSPEITTHYLKDVELVIALPHSLLVEKVDQSWSDMAQLPWIYSDHYCPFQKIVDDLFEKHNLTITQKVLTNDESTKLDLVRKGVGAALLLADECQQAQAKGEITVWKTDPMQCELNLAYLSSRETDPLISALITCVLDIWGNPA